MGLQRLGRHIAARHLEPVERRQVLGQQAGLERQGRPPLLLEEQRVVDGDGHPARDDAEEVAVVSLVTLVLPLGQVGHGQAHHAEQLTADQERRRDDRCQAHAPGGLQAPLGRRPRRLVPQVLHEHGIQARHGLLAEVAFRVVNRVANPGPALRGRCPAVGVHLHPPHQLLAMEQVDHAMIGEVRHQRLGHVPQGQAELKRPRELFPNALQQPDLIPLTLAAAPDGLARDDDDAVDGA